MTWTPPPNWPPKPSSDWVPPAGWVPPVEWGPAPPGWNFWPGTSTRSTSDKFAEWVTSHKLLSGAAGAFVLVIIIVAAATGGGSDGSTPANTIAVPKTSQPTPKSTPTSRSTPTPHLSAEESLRQALLAKIGESNIDKSEPRIKKVHFSGKLMQIPFLIDDNVTHGLRTEGAKYDVVDMLQIVRAHEKSFPKADEVGFFGYFPATDNLGRTKLQQVVTVDYTFKRLNKINFKGIDPTNVYGCDESRHR